jgi:hypothetical protein
MDGAMRSPASALGLALALAISSSACTNAAAASGRPVLLAQAMVPPTGMMDAEHPTPMEQRYLDRYPQPAQVGILIGLPVLDLNASTIGHVEQVVRTSKGKIELIVSYSWWWGWFGRPVAAPIEVLGIEGRQLVSLDMPPSEYAASPTWQSNGDTILPADATIKVALARN